MKRLERHLVGISQGSRVLFSDFADDGPMWTGTGPREHRTAISFEDAYSDIPVVHVTMSMWDIDHKTNHRMDLTAENVTENGFDLVFRTWGDSRVARVRASWLVMGELRSAEDWDLY